MVAIATVALAGVRPPPYSHSDVNPEFIQSETLVLMKSASLESIGQPFLQELDRLIEVVVVSDDTLRTGCTSFLFERGLTSAMMLLGSAPASKDVMCLQPGCAVEAIWGVHFTGGSVMGLESQAGAVRRMRMLDRGVPTRERKRYIYIYIYIL